MTRTGSYQALLIDLDGTVVDYARTESAALSEIYRIFFCRYAEFAKFSAAFREVNDELWEAYRQGETDLETLRTERFARMSDQLGLPGPASGVPAIVSRFEHELGRRAELFADSLAALRALRKLATLVLVTDGIAAVQHAKLARTRLRGLFDHVVISSEVGFRKPDPRLLRHALARARVGRQHALVVGDSLASDGAGASAAGVDFCWVNRDGATAPPGLAGLAAATSAACRSASAGSDTAGSDTSGSDTSGPDSAWRARPARAARATQRFQVPDLATLAGRLCPGAVLPLAPAVRAAGAAGLKTAPVSAQGWQAVVQPELQAGGLGLRRLGGRRGGPEDGADVRPWPLQTGSARPLAAAGIGWAETRVCRPAGFPILGL